MSKKKHKLKSQKRTSDKLSSLSDLSTPSSEDITASETVTGPIIPTSPTDPAHPTDTSAASAAVPTEFTERGGRKTFSNHLILNDAQHPKAKWYVLHTYSGHEGRVTQTLLQRIQTLGLENRVFEILIPTQERIQIQSGKKANVTEKLFPGYILIRLILDDDTWLAVRTTAGITGFIGMGNKPTPISAAEVKSIQKFMSIAAPKFKNTFSTGEAVRITDGPFTEMLGTVDSIDDERGKLKVLVSIFGRETPVELDFLQVTKIW